MKIKLQGIGLIKNSEIELNGLTVITGDNNSGKTTVGKVVYSLFDAVADLQKKAKADRDTYARKKVMAVRDNFQFFVPYFQYMGSKTQDIDSSDSASGRSYLYYLAYNTFFFKRKKIDFIDFAHNLYNEIKEFQRLGLDMFDEEIHQQLNEDFNFMFSQADSEKPNSIKEYIDNTTEYSLKILEDLFKRLEADPQLADYAKENIYQTLKTEFDGQIQPVSAAAGSSGIALTDLNKTYFRFAIADNKIVSNGRPVFFGTTIKKTFFVDNPFILDPSSSLYPSDPRILESGEEHIVNENRILRHDVKLKNYLKAMNMNIFELNIFERDNKKINEKIDDVLSGDFEFSANGDYYVTGGGQKLRYSNLATGSKLFSILKLLLNKGALDESTMLILDEPEAHLHPAWQNKFAEIIVLLVKELGVKVLLTSHSPNFVLAVEAFMHKYKINDKTSFYQTRFIDGGFAEYVNVDDDIGAIYADFTLYLSEVKMLRDKYAHGLGDEDD